MGYIIKVQKVERPTNRSFYLNLPAVLAEALDIQKESNSNGSSKTKTPSSSPALNPAPRHLKHKP